ncbi:helix-turn-helix domain-containing protein [Acidimangrovimonas sediminis]|uniref:helix-turn-helix domain-containing protein n=1 Tax=Acidimangrovimonas sediminis TaxID=2056283 RepID=UPI000C801117|nr:helix-turn-helix domain-containing protein [Acidimangrovimonas sediminis]
MERISHYFLYGEDQQTAESDFLHVEAIPVRSGAHDWTIRPHSHPEHSQILLVSAGGGELDIEGQRMPVEPPCLMVLPAGTVHAIAFAPATEGQVATVATSYSRPLIAGDPQIAAALATPAVYPLDHETIDALGIASSFEWLQREFVRAYPGRHLAVRAQVERLLVALLRLHLHNSSRLPPRTRGDLHLVNRFRDLLEDHYRVEKQLGFYTGRLGVSLSKLNAACRARTGMSASKLLHARLVVEAKRSLLYSRNTVAEIAHSLGFEDPAYFSRFFTKRVGAAPGTFRQQRRDDG